MAGAVLSLYKHNLLKNCFSLRCLQFSSVILNISQKQNYCTLPGKDNPLLNLDGLPDFKQVTGNAINEALPYMLNEAEQLHASHEKQLANKSASWDEVITKSEQIFDPLSLAWSAIQHLHGVKNNAALREAYQKVFFYFFILTYRFLFFFHFD